MLLTDRHSLLTLFAQRRVEGMRQRGIADSLGITEATLVALHCGNVTRIVSPLTAIRLDSTSWPALSGALPSLGRVMALTRNHACVHEKKGTYTPCHTQGSTGLVVGPDINVRLFYRHWHTAFAVEEHRATDIQRSLQIFDVHGTAVHKIFLQEHSLYSAYQELVRRFKSPNQTADFIPLPKTELSSPQCNVKKNIEPFQRAEPGQAHSFPPSVLPQLLEALAAQKIPIMVFVASPGAIQIHTGPIHTITLRGPWLNILDPDFNLHLRSDLVAEAWCVRTPTTDGIVTSIELYDDAEECIALFFGARKEGQHELESWRSLAESLTNNNQC